MVVGRKRGGGGVKSFTKQWYGLHTHVDLITFNHQIISHTCIVIMVSNNE